MAREFFALIRSYSEHIIILPLTPCRSLAKVDDFSIVFPSTSRSGFQQDPGTDIEKAITS